MYIEIRKVNIEYKNDNLITITYIYNKFITSIFFLLLVIFIKWEEGVLKMITNS